MSGGGDAESEPILIGRARVTHGVGKAGESQWVSALWGNGTLYKHLLSAIKMTMLASRSRESGGPFLQCFFPILFNCAREGVCGKLFCLTLV